MVLQREMWKRKFQHWSTTTGRFMTALNNTFTADFGSSAMHLPPITIDDKPRPHKRARYTPYLLPAAIYIASEILL